MEESFLLAAVIRLWAFTIGGSILIVLGIVCLVYLVRILRDLSEMTAQCKEGIIRICSIGSGIGGRMKTVVEIAQMFTGALSTLQRNRGRGKK